MNAPPVRPGSPTGRKAMKKMIRWSRILFLGLLVAALGHSALPGRDSDEGEKAETAGDTV